MSSRHTGVRPVTGTLGATTDKSPGTAVPAPPQRDPSRRTRASEATARAPDRLTPETTSPSVLTTTTGRPTGSDRTSDAVIWRFTARAGVEAWARDLADREAACCPFLTYTVAENNGEVTNQIAGDDDPMIHAILDEIQQLPGRIGDGLPGLVKQLKDVGLDVQANDDGITVTAPTTTADSGSNA